MYLLEKKSACKWTRTVQTRVVQGSPVIRAPSTSHAGAEKGREKAGSVLPGRHLRAHGPDGGTWAGTGAQERHLARRGPAEAGSQVSGCWSRWRGPKWAEEVVCGVSSHPEAPWVFQYTHSKHSVTPPHPTPTPIKK